MTVKMMSPDELLAKATTFLMWSQSSDQLTVEARGNDRWTIVFGGTSVYDKDIDSFAFEPSPSNREKEFIQATRYTRDEAIELSLTLAQRMQHNYDEWVANGRKNYFNALKNFGANNDE